VLLPHDYQHTGVAMYNGPSRHTCPECGAPLMAPDDGEACYAAAKERFYQEHLKPSIAAVLSDTEKDLDENDLVIIHEAALHDIGVKVRYPITVDVMKRLRAEIEQDLHHD
jgi:hypothetical protein